MSDNIVVTKLSKEEREVFDNVDSVISRAVTVGDPLLALEYGNSLRRKQQVEGLALAKLLYKLRQSWSLFQSAGTDDDLIAMADVHMNVKPITAKKYMDMWEDIFENPQVPEDIKTILQGRPIGDLLLLTAAVGEGSLAGSDLRHAALAPDKASLREYIRKARGEATSSSSAVTICLKMQDGSKMKAGTLYVKQGDEYEVIGTLNIGDDDKLVQKGINRIKNSAGVMEVWK